MVSGGVVTPSDLLLFLDNELLPAANGTPEGSIHLGSYLLEVHR